MRSGYIGLRRIGRGLALVGLVAGALLAPPAVSAHDVNNCGDEGPLRPYTVGDKKVDICHRTGSAKNPYVLITPSVEGAIKGHCDHEQTGHGEGDWGGLGHQ